MADADAARHVSDVTTGTPGIASAAAPVASVDGTLVLIDAVLDDEPDSAAARATIENLRDRLAGLEGSRARVGGETAKQVDVADAGVRDAATVMPAVLVVVLVVLGVLLRAVVGPLVLLGSVLLSYVAALGAGGLAMGLLGFDAVDVSFPLLAFVFLVALGVDYTIFLMSRVREEVGAHGPYDGVRRGLVATGAVITSAGVVLAATFAVLTVMPTVFMIGMGMVVAVGILLDTFVVRSLVVPGLAIDLGHRFWAPSRSVPAARAEKVVAPG